MATGGGPTAQVPQSLKAIAPYIRIATEHDAKNPVVAYWCRFYALENGLKVNKLPEDRAYLVSLMNTLERMKAENRENEAFTNDIVAQSTIEAHAIKLFSWADTQDRNGNADKSVIRAFHAAGYIFDLLNNFGEVSEEVTKMTKYAKWKAAYIYKCLKEGTRPIPGPLKGDDEGFEEDAAGPSAVQPAQPGFGGVASDAGVAPTPMPRASQGGGGPSNELVDFGLPPVPQMPRPPKDESTGAYPKVPPAQQPPAPGPAYPPAAPPAFVPPPVPAPGATPPLDVNMKLKAQKYCKFASSALTYDDVPTAIQNLHKCLSLLTTGVDPE